MPEFLKNIFTSAEFMPHGYCYLWQPELVWLHVVSDSLIAFAYYSIPLILIYFVRKRRDVPFDAIFWMFGAFIITSGTTHLMEVWTLWHPSYWLSGSIKAITAVVSLLTAGILLLSIPKALPFPSSTQLEAINQTLRDEITQRQQVEEALRDSEARLQALLDNAPNIIYLKDQQGQYLLVNRQYERVFHLSKEQIIGKSDYDLFPAETANEFRVNDQHVLSGETPVEEEEIVPQEDGLHTYISIKFPLYNTHGEAYAICGISTDITQRKAAENARKESEERLQAVLDNAPNAIYLKDIEGRYILVNRQFENIVQLSKEQFIGKSDADLFPAEVAEELCAHDQQVLRERQPVEQEGVFPQSDGWHTYLTIKFPLYTSSDIAYGICGISTDITKRKQAEQLLREALDQREVQVQRRTAELAKINVFLQAEIIERKRVEDELRNREARYQMVARATNDAIWDWNLATNEVEWNESVQVLFGYASTEVSCDATWWYENIHPADRERVVAGIHQVIDSGEQMWKDEYRFLRTNGSYALVIDRGFVIHDDQGNPIRMVGSMMDITERKRTEDALKNLVAGTAGVIGEKFFSALVQHLASALGVRCAFVSQSLDEAHERAKTLALWVDDQLGENFEYSIANTPCEQVLHQGTVCYYPHQVQKLFPQSQHLTMINAVCYLGVPLYNSTEQLIGTLCIINDNPLFEEQHAQSIMKIFAARAVAELERQQAESALRQSEEQLRLALRATHLGYWDWDITTNTITWSDAVEPIFGLPPGSFAGTFAAVLECIHPEDREKIATLVARTLEQQTELEVEYEYRVVWPDSTIHWVSSRGQCFYNDQGQIVRMLGTCLDDTERKLSELERERLLTQLEQERSQLEAVLRQLPAGVIIAEAPTGRLLLGNRQVEQWHHAFLPSEDIEQYQNWQGFHLNGQPYQLEEWPLTRSIRTGEVVTDEEIEILRGDGTRATVLVSSTPVRDREGTIIAGVVTFYDITERKQTEQALRDALQKLSFHVENTPLAVMEWNHEARSQRWSKQAEKIFGWTSEEVRGKSWLEWQFIYEEDFEIVKAHGTGLVDGTQPSCVTYNRNYTKDGSVIDCEWYNSALFDESGHLVSILSLVQDITERKRAEQEIRELNVDLEQRVAQRTAELESLINAMPDYIFVIEHDTMRILFCSDLFAKGLGFKNRQQVQEKTIFECFSPAEAQYFAQQNSEVFTSGQVLHLQEGILLPDGLHHFDTYKIPLKNDNGEVYALMGSSRDITELVNMRQILSARTTQLEVANQELNAFCYSVSHDLRAPLRGIDGFSKALLERYADQLDEKGKHYLERIRAGSQRMGQLIDDLLHLSRVTRSEMNRQQVNLSVITQEIAAELQLMQPERQVEWVIAEELMANGDAQLLRIVLENLLNNAWKFTSKQPSTRIEFNGMFQEDGEFVYFVRDNGAGFDMAYADKLFGAFQRLHTVIEFPGTGIGLATVQRVIHRHGGRVWAEGVVGQGATFYFTL